MRTLNSEGFGERSISCNYEIGRIAGQRVVIFVQTSLSKTSITNVIEELVNKVLERGLRGSRPDGILFFEHYLPSLQPLRVWQEVAFSEHEQVFEKEGFLRSIARFLRGEPEKSNWAVASPKWGSVSTGLATDLNAIVA